MLQYEHCFKVCVNVLLEYFNAGACYFSEFSIRVY